MTLWLICDHWSGIILSCPKLDSQLIRMSIGRHSQVATCDLRLATCDNMRHATCDIAVANRVFEYARHPHHEGLMYMVGINLTCSIRWAQKRDFRTLNKGQVDLRANFKIKGFGSHCRAMWTELFEYDFLKREVWTLLYTSSYTSLGTNLI